MMETGGIVNFGVPSDEEDAIKQRIAKVTYFKIFLRRKINSFIFFQGIYAR